MFSLSGHVAETVPFSALPDTKLGRKAAGTEESYY